MIAGGLASFPIPRVQFCQEPERGVFSRLSVSPVLSFALLHAGKKSMERAASCAEKPSIRSKK